MYATTIFAGTICSETVWRRCSVTVLVFVRGAKSFDRHLTTSVIVWGQLVSLCALANPSTRSRVPSVQIKVRRYRSRRVTVVNWEVNSIAKSRNTQASVPDLICVPPDLHAGDCISSGTLEKRVSLTANLPQPFSNLGVALHSASRSQNCESAYTYTRKIEGAVRGQLDARSSAQR